MKPVSVQPVKPLFGEWAGVFSSPIRWFLSLRNKIKMWSYNRSIIPRKERALPSSHLSFVLVFQTDPDSLYLCNNTHQLTKQNSDSSRINEDNSKLPPTSESQYLEIAQCAFATGCHRFPLNNFKHFLTLFSKFFSSFPHGTCSLSVSRCVFSFRWDLPPT